MFVIFNITIGNIIDFIQYNAKRVRNNSGFTLIVSSFVVYPIYNTPTFKTTLNNVVSTGNTISTLVRGEKHLTANKDSTEIFVIHMGL
jgi:hypothetical protein